MAFLHHQSDGRDDDALVYLLSLRSTVVIYI